MSLNTTKGAFFYREAIGNTGDIIKAVFESQTSSTHNGIVGGAKWNRAPTEEDFEELTELLEAVRLQGSPQSTIATSNKLECIIAARESATLDPAAVKTFYKEEIMPKYFIATTEEYIAQQKAAKKEQKQGMKKQRRNSTGAPSSTSTSTTSAAASTAAATLQQPENMNEGEEDSTSSSSTTASTTTSSRISSASTSRRSNTSGSTSTSAAASIAAAALQQPEDMIEDEEDSTSSTTTTTSPTTNTSATTAGTGSDSANNGRQSSREVYIEHCEQLANNPTKMKWWEELLDDLKDDSPKKGHINDLLCVARSIKRAASRGNTRQ
jgi:hypothetical protein